MPTVVTHYHEHKWMISIFLKATNLHRIVPEELLTGNNVIIYFRSVVSRVNATAATVTKCFFRCCLLNHYQL